MMLLEYKPSCTCCGQVVDKVVPDPRDCEQEFMVCEACEYEITERASMEYFNDSPKDYGSMTHGF